MVHLIPSLNFNTPAPPTISSHPPPTPLHHTEPTAIFLTSDVTPTHLRLYNLHTSYNLAFASLETYLTALSSEIARHRSEVSSIQSLRGELCFRHTSQADVIRQFDWERWAQARLGVLERESVAMENKRRDAVEDMRKVKRNIKLCERIMEQMSGVLMEGRWIARAA